LPESEPELWLFARELGKKLAEVAIRRQGRRTGLLIGSINDIPAREHFLARFLEDAGFVNTALGFQMRRVTPTVIGKDETEGAARVSQDGGDKIEPDTVRKA
jgi:ATP-dependent Lhr-like helicase